MSFNSLNGRIHFRAEEQVELEQGGEVQEEAVGDEADVVLAAVLQPVGPWTTQAGQAGARLLGTGQAAADHIASVCNNFVHHHQHLYPT